LRKFFKRRKKDGKFGRVKERYAEKACGTEQTYELPEANLEYDNVIISS